jgi:ABC-type Fe3+/spermidine/putrescine transport system ATPase subunit
MIRIERLTARQGGFLLGPIDLELEHGAYLTILGPSGAGKTVLLEACLGLIQVAAGRLWLDGIEASRLSPELRKIAYLPQDLALFPHLSVKDNILFGARRKQQARQSIDQRFNELTSLLDLGGILEGRTIGSLSGGERQRVALARALLPGPRVLFLDEPFSALDAAIKRQLQIKLRQINRDLAVTILHVTHDQEEALLLGERIAVMIGGQLIQIGSRDDIYYRPANLAVARFLRNQNIYERQVEQVLANGDFKLDGEPPLLTSGCAGVGPGDRVAVGIRSEEVTIIRPGRPLGPDLQENLFDARIVDILGFGGTHTLTVVIAGSGVPLDVELPNCAFRDRGYAIGDHLQIALRRRSLWSLPLNRASGSAPPQESGHAEL